jgi:hypothetical protein
MLKTVKVHQLSRKSNIYQKFSRSINNIHYWPSDHTYNLTISKERNFIWFMVPKVGYSTYLKILETHEIPLSADRLWDVFYPPAYYQDYFKFGFVRNPWDRVVSCWKHSVFDHNYFKFSESDRIKMQNLDIFLYFISSHDLKIADAHIKAQVNLIDLNNVDFIGRFENINSDLRFVFDKIGIKIENIPIENKSSREFSNYKDFYNESTAAMVAKLYDKDIRMFGYTF